MSQKRNSNADDYGPPSSSNDGQDPDLSLLSHDKQPFYLRLLQRDNSSCGLSSRRRLTPSLVPFLWESSPGLPKPNFNSDHHDTPYILAPPPIMQQHHMSCSFASARQYGGSRSADDSWLCSQIKTAFRRSRRNSPLLNSMLLMDSSSPSVGSGGRDEIQSPRSMLDMQGQLGSSSSSSDSDHFQAPGSAKKLRGCNSRKPIIQSSSRLYKKLTSSKIKNNCCFHMPECEL